MDYERESTEQADTTSVLEKIKKQLTSCGAGKVLLQGSLLKRSDIIRKWEWRWFALDVSTGKLEYWSRRGDTSPKGVVKFDAYSTVAVSPINMMKDPKYDACCFHVITSQRKEYFFCAETPGAAEAWVTTLRAAVSVLKAHKEASSLLSGNTQYNLGNVATVVAAANVTAREAAQELQISMKAAALSPSASFKTSVSASPFSPSASFKKFIPAAALSPSASKKSISAAEMDSSDLMRETLKVKVEEIHQLGSDIKSRDLIIKELADRLTETADVAESAASSVLAVDKHCNEALSEVDHLRKELLQAVEQIRDADARRASALKFEETALQEAHRCRLELGKLRERGVILEAAMVRVEEDIRRLKVVHESEIAGRLKLQLTRMEIRPQAEISLTDEVLQEDNASEAADVNLKVDEPMTEACLVHAILPDTQAPELELAGSCEDLVSGLRMETCILSVNTSTPCMDGASPSLSGTDHHEYAVSVCPSASSLPEVVYSDDDKAVPPLPSTFADCGITMIANHCKDASSKVIVMASGSEGLCNLIDDSSEIEVAVIDEVNMITMEGNELATGAELSGERTAVKQEPYKREGFRWPL